MRKSLNKLEMMQSCVDMEMKLGKPKAVQMLKETFEKMSNPENEDAMGPATCVFCETYQFDFFDCLKCPYDQWETDGGFGCLNLKRAFKNGFEYSKQRAKDYKFMVEFTKGL